MQSLVDGVAKPPLLSSGILATLTSTSKRPQVLGLLSSLYERSAEHDRLGPPRLPPERAIAESGFGSLGREQREAKLHDENNQLRLELDRAMPLEHSAAARQEVLSLLGRRNRHLIDEVDAAVDRCIAEVYRNLGAELQNSIEAKRDEIVGRIASTGSACTEVLFANQRRRRLSESELATVNKITNDDCISS
jgi:hypothetical protein